MFFFLSTFLKNLEVFFVVVVVLVLVFVFFLIRNTVNLMQWLCLFYLTMTTQSFELLTFLLCLECISIQ